MMIMQLRINGQNVIGEMDTASGCLSAADFELDSAQIPTHFMFIKLEVQRYE